MMRLKKLEWFSNEARDLKKVPDLSERKSGPQSSNLAFGNVTNFKFNQIHSDNRDSFK